MGKSSALRAAAAAGAAFVLTTPAAAGKPAAALFAMTPADFAGKVTSKDDQLETRAEFDTSKGWVESPSDVFLRAYVDKKTGAATFELYSIVTFLGDWRSYRTINYGDASGAVREGNLVSVDDNANCATLHYSNRCELTEQVVFDVPEDLLRGLAGSYKPGAAVAWKFKLKGKYADADYVNGVVPAEAAGLLAAVDAYRAKLTRK